LKEFTYYVVDIPIYVGYGRMQISQKIPIDLANSVTFYSVLHTLFSNCTLRFLTWVSEYASYSLFESQIKSNYPKNNNLIFKHKIYKHASTVVCII
jgi:hypothetical protein